MEHAATALDISIADLSYYNLRSKPFLPTVDPKFLWLAKRHRDGLATLKAGILRNVGLLLLTGDVGTGKTTLVNALVDGLGDEIIVAKIGYPSLKPVDFFRAIAAAYSFRGDCSSRETFLTELREFLADAHRNKRTVLLVIDEAQSLNPELFDEILYLTRIRGNPASRPTSPLNVLLVGQKRLDAILSEPENRVLMQRVGVRWTVELLSEEEVGQYIGHRLGVAGSERNLFSGEAIREVCAVSGGVPRLINAICERALSSGCRQKAQTIGPEIVTEAARHLGTPDPSRERVARKRRALPILPASTGRLVGRAGALAAGVTLLALVAIVAGYVAYPGREGERPQASLVIPPAEPSRAAPPVKAWPEPVAPTTSAGSVDASIDWLLPIPNQAAPGWRWRNRWSEVTQPQSQEVPDSSDEARAQAPTQRSSGDPADAQRHVIDLIRPAIVRVRTSDAVTRREEQCVARAPDAKSGSPRRRGLGFIVDPGGYIATNNHVVSGSTTIEVTLHDGRTLPVVLLAREPRSDLAVLKVDATGLPTIALGDSNALRMGDHVMSIGDPIGEGALAMGIITAIGRDIATNVPINPQCHGLPLLNARGEAVGIAAARVAESGRPRTAALAVPIQRLKPILQDLQTLESPSHR